MRIGYEIRISSSSSSSSSCCMHVVTSDFGKMGNPFSARSYRLSHAASQVLRGQEGDVRVGRNPGGSILRLLGTQDRRLGSPPDDVTFPFNPTGNKHLNPGAIITTQYQF